MRHVLNVHSSTSTIEGCGMSHRRHASSTYSFASPSSTLHSEQSSDTQNRSASSSSRCPRRNR